MQFGMPTLIENDTLADNIALCRELGLSFVELNMNFPEYQVEKLEWTDLLAKMGEEAGVYFTIHLDENLNVADFNPRVSGAYLETVRRTIEVAKKLVPLKNRFGDPSQPLTINMHMHHGIYITLPDRKVQLYERYFPVYVDAIERFRDLCTEWIGDSDVRIVVENTDGFKNYEMRAIELMLMSPVFGLTWDIGHSKGIKEIDVPFIREHEDRLLHMHVHDATEQGRNHLALGDGELNLAERLATAERHNTRCVLETKTIEALQKSVAWLSEREKK